MTEIITGWRKIADAFGVNRTAVMKWQAQGAPIVLLPGKISTPCTSIPELWAWLKGRYGRGEKDVEQGEGRVKDTALPSPPAQPHELMMG